MKFLSATSSCCSVYYALLYRRESFSRKYTTRKILKNYISDGISDSLLPLQSDAIGDTWPEYISLGQEKAFRFALVAWVNGL